ALAVALGSSFKAARLALNEDPSGIDATSQRRSAPWQATGPVLGSIAGPPHANGRRPSADAGRSRRRLAGGRPVRRPPGSPGEAQVRAPARLVARRRSS